MLSLKLNVYFRLTAPLISYFKLHGLAATVLDSIVLGVLKKKDI